MGGTDDIGDVVGCGGVLFAYALAAQEIADPSGDDFGGVRNGNNGTSHACTATCAGFSGVGSVG